MPRWALILLTVIGVVCAGVGVGLLLAPGGAGFGWTAYAPLAPHRYAAYPPTNFPWLQWRPRVGAALLALGAGATGAAGTALLLTRHRAAAAAARSADRVSASA